jgi:RimJ/RimL family protein N-acetyltransferase
MNFEFQPHLENDVVRLQPLKNEDFDTLYHIASDPLVWEQHPNPNRYKREVFEVFFRGAIESKGSFLIFDKATNTPIGTSRFYEFNPQEDYVAIGYTFFARNFWGTTHNQATKTLMLEHAFKFVNHVIFHIWVKNIRSQKAIEKLGAKKMKEIEMAYYGEENKMNFIYQIDKNDKKGQK